MTSISTSPHHLCRHAHRSVGPLADGFDLPVKPSKSLDMYLRYALQTLSERDQVLPDKDHLILIVEAALSAQALLFTASLRDPDPAELHRFFDLFILAAVSPEKRSNP